MKKLQKDSSSGKNPQARDRFLIFSQRDTRGLILDYLDDRSFLNFGMACRAFMVYMMLDQRFGVLKPSYKFKLQQPNLYYEYIFQELRQKYCQDAVQKLPPHWSAHLNMQMLDITLWREQALACLQALYDGVTLARMTGGSRMGAIRSIGALKSGLALVMPGTNLDFAVLLTLRKCSEDQLRQLDANTPLLNDPRNQFVALDIDATAAEVASEDPLEQDGKKYE